VDRLYFRLPGNKDEWKCRFCEFQTDVYTRMRYHGKMGHRKPGEKLFKCDVCSKEFSAPSSYQLHMKMHRTGGERKYKCGKCMEAFRMKHHLRRHEMVIHGNGSNVKKSIKKEQLDCDICQKKLANKDSLRRHMETIHNGNAAQFECPVCQVKLASKQRYLRHLETQHGDKSNQVEDQDTQRVQCGQCGKAFKNVAAMNVHISKMHSDMEEMQKAARHFCELCDKGFVSKSELRYHTMRHTGELPFRCEKCGFGYPTQSELRKHQIKSKCGKGENFEMADELSKLLEQKA